MDNIPVDQAEVAQQHPVVRPHNRPRMVYSGIWVREGRLGKDELGNWHRAGRLLKTTMYKA